MRVIIVAVLTAAAGYMASASDVIVDRKGDEIVCTVDSVGRERVYYRADVPAEAPQASFSRRDVFMIKYSDGRKVIIGGGVAGPAEIVDSTRLIYCSVMGNYGLFGLFNVESDSLNIESRFTKARYSAGFTPYAEIRFHRRFAAGVECIVLWGQPITSDAPRLIIDPSVRFKALFPVLDRLRVEPLIAAGVTWWPAVGGSASLDSTFFDNRLGWNARAALGFDYAVTSAFSIILEAGYTARSSQSRGIWITHDMMLVSIGPRFSF